MSSRGKETIPLLRILSIKAHVQGLDWLPSLRTAKREEVEAPEEDEEV